MIEPKSYAAVILYFRAGEQVWETARRIRDQSLAPSEIVVVDNGSNDGVCDNVPLDLPVRVLRLTENLGYSSGMRAGFSALRSSAQWVLMATHEVVLDPECAERLVDEGVRAKAAQVGPAVHATDTGQPWSRGGSFTATGNTTHAPGLRTQQLAPRPVSWLEGCCHLVRRTAVSEALFDGRYFLYWDDVDMSATLSTQGPIICAPSARCSQSTQGQITYFSVRNRILFWQKQKKARFVIAALLETIAQIGRDLLRNDSDHALARARGLTDGLSGRLSYKRWEAKSL